MKNIKYLTISYFVISLVVLGCGSKERKYNLNGTYTWSCGSSDDRFVVKDDSIVEFYNSDGYDLSKDMKEEYDPNKPLTKKWVLRPDNHTGKIKQVNDQVVVYDDYDTDTFSVTQIDNGTIIILSREIKKTLEDEMRNPNSLDCYWNKNYHKEK